MRKEPNPKDYYYHDECPPKLRGEKCCGDCMDCRDQDLYDFRKGKNVVVNKPNINEFLPERKKKYMFRGRLLK
jgi:hypothetical protein